VQAMLDMRRIFVITLKGAAVPIGIGLGLGLALLPNGLACAVFIGPRGNGTTCPHSLDLSSVSQPRFAWWLCAICGAAAAGAVLLISGAMSRSTRRNGAAPRHEAVQGR
jgi:hypothetical protein